MNFITQLWQKLIAFFNDKSSHSDSHDQAVATWDSTKTDNFLVHPETVESTPQTEDHASTPPTPPPPPAVEHWWTLTPPPQEPLQAFEQINPDEVYSSISAKLQNHQFPVIEIPSNIIRTMQLLNNADFNYIDVATLINQSPAMAGEFIAILNSPIYNRGKPVHDLRSALPRLGRENIKALLYTFSAKSSLAAHPLFNSLAEKIVEHSRATALIAAYLSQRYFPDADMAFLAGLLHNIGKLGILKTISDSYHLPRDIGYTLEEEHFCHIFPGLYERAGEFLVSSWNIDPIVGKAILHQNDFSDTPFEEEEDVTLALSALVNMASTMARILGKGPRFHEPVNALLLPAAAELNLEYHQDTIKFLEYIPIVVKRT